MTPHIRTTWCAATRPIQGLDDFTGLALVEFAVVPHFNDAAESEPEVVDYSRTFEGTVYAVPDGAAILVEGDRLKCVGPVPTMRAGRWLQ